MSITPRHIKPWQCRLQRMLLACVASLLLGAIYLWQTTPLPTAEHLRVQAALGDTRILDRNGRLIAAMPDPLGQSRQPITLAEIPLALRQATIAVEDASFYSNIGIDPRGIARALWQNASTGEIVAGGSTITQQLARNFLLDPTLGQQQSVERKLREIVLALKLTSSYSKDEILTLYLNQTYYGGTAYGVEAAAWRLFGKPAHELDLAEAALIAGLPQAPSRYDPLADAGSTAHQRQRQVLDAMQRSGFLNHSQVEAAANEPLSYSSGACRPGTCEYLAPHFVGFVLNELAESLGSEVLARGGLTITTTLDLGLQQASQAILQRQITLLSNPHDGSPNHQAHNGAIVVLDPHDGAVLAMVGSPNFADRSIQGQVNAATARRQPGSALKPLTYAAALEHGFTPASILLDIPTSFATREGQPYTPQNYDRHFHGPISLREALATSSNIAAVRTLQAIGIPALLDLAERLGIHSLGENPNRFGLALTLGGGEVTLLELTGAYAGLANQGMLVQPYVVIAISGHGVGTGHAMGATQNLASPNQQLPLPSHQPAQQDHQPTQQGQALSPQIAYLISDILADPYARMRAFGSALEIDRPAAVKTGTSTDWHDNWTIGYTPNRVVGVWVGNADGSPMEAVSGVTGAGPVWRAVMREAHRGVPVRQFTRPTGIVLATICADSGMLPSPSCPTTRQELFVAGTQPQVADTTHVKLRVDLDGTCRVLADFPQEQSVIRTYRILPVEAQIWAINARIPQIPRRTCRKSSNNTPTLPQPGLNPANADIPTITSPASGSFFAISPSIARQRQQLEIMARADLQAEQVTLLVDGKSIATFHAAPYRTFWQLEPGRHTLAIQSIDEHGRATQGEEVIVIVE